MAHGGPAPPLRKVRMHFRERSMACLSSLSDPCLSPPTPQRALVLAKDTSSDPPCRGALPQAQGCNTAQCCIAMWARHSSLMLCTHDSRNRIPTCTAWLLSLAAQRRPVMCRRGAPCSSAEGSWTGQPCPVNNATPRTRRTCGRVMEAAPGSAHVFNTSATQQQHIRGQQQC